MSLGMRSSLALTNRMLRHFAASSPATGSFRGNDRKVNLEEKSYE
ncbi:MAG: hypothetical protein RL132_1292 [Pseudomonadota bacterium]|jgi:hypothetical protein